MSENNEPQEFRTMVNGEWWTFTPEAIEAILRNYAWDQGPTLSQGPNIRNILHGEVASMFFLDKVDKNIKVNVTYRRYNFG